MAPEKRQASFANVPLHFIHNQSVVHLEGQTCPPSSTATFANGLARPMPGSSRLGERFQWRRVLLLSVYFIPRSIQRGAFFLTVEQERATFSERGPDETFRRNSWAGVTNENPNMRMYILVLQSRQSVRRLVLLAMKNYFNVRLDG